MSRESTAAVTHPSATRRLTLLGIGPKAPWPVTCGGSEGIHGAIEALARHFDVVYACPAPAASAEQIEHYDRIGVEYRPIGFEPSESLGDIVSATLQGLPFKFHKYSSGKALAAFDREVGSINPDAILCFHAHTEALGRGLCKLRGWNVPIVLREHNIEYEMARSICSSMSPLKRLAAEPFLRLTEREERRMWARSDCVAFLSESDLAAARATGIRGRFELVPEGVPLPPRRTVSYPGTNAPLLIPFNPNALQSRNNTIKFLRDYWRAVANLPLLAGTRLAVTAVDAPQLAALSGISEEEQRNLRIDALGFLPSLAPWFQSALAVVAPTFFGSGIRKKVLEAMANQVPVVATELDLGTCHYFDAGRNILLMGEPSAFAQTVAALRNSPEQWLTLVESGRATVEEHASWEGFARAMRGQIEALLAGRAGRPEPR
jgi:glycosyltransferase involved in cell wall biosynthesis